MTVTEFDRLLAPVTPHTGKDHMKIPTQFDDVLAFVTGFALALGIGYLLTALVP